MARKKHGCYCKICGEYKSNESFSGRGRASHICKTCSLLPAAEKAEQETMNKLMNMTYGNISKTDDNWLKNRTKDKRADVAELAKEVYAQRHPHAARNEIKKGYIINHLIFDVNIEIPNEWGDYEQTERQFEIDRVSGLLFMREGETINQVRLPNATKTLRWAVHTLELFMWPQDYGDIVVAVDDVCGTPEANGAQTDEDIDDADDDIGVEDVDERFCYDEFLDEPLYIIKAPDPSE